MRRVEGEDRMIYWFIVAIGLMVLGWVYALLSVIGFPVC